MSILFAPTRIGPYMISHRVVLAPLSRMRSSEGDIPNGLMAEYYSQRASEGGLLITEATTVSRQGSAAAKAPGIYADEQISGWKKVAEAVHAKGGRIFLQLFHAGRQSHSDLQPNKAAPVAPSAIQAHGRAFTHDGLVELSKPRALELHELPAIVETFRRGAERALSARFDGVEVHGANGYLLDQFLQDGSNKRTDDYGGPIAHRARLLLEATEAAISVFGAERVGVRLAPSAPYGDMSDSDPARTFGYAAGEMSRYGLAYLHIVEPRIKETEPVPEQKSIAAKHIRKIFNGPIIAAGGFTKVSAEAILQAGDVDLVAFGRHFISNPDLPHRFRIGAALAPYDRKTFYIGGATGYTDYGCHQEAAST